MSRDRYRLAGVDVAAGDEAVARMRAAVEGTFGPEVIGGFGGFSAATVLPPGLRDPVLILAADGVGTKTALAAELGRFGGLGQDLVAMCVDDVACSGAQPLFMLDYIATERLDPSDRGRGGDLDRGWLPAWRVALSWAARRRSIAGCWLPMVSTWPVSASAWSSGTTSWTGRPAASAT